MDFRIDTKVEPDSFGSALFVSWPKTREDWIEGVTGMVHVRGADQTTSEGVNLKGNELEVIAKCKAWQDLKNSHRLLLLHAYVPTNLNFKHYQIIKVNIFNPSYIYAFRQQNTRVLRVWDYVRPCWCLKRPQVIIPITIDSAKTVTRSLSLKFGSPLALTCRSLPEPWPSSSWSAT